MTKILNAHVLKELIIYTFRSFLFFFCLKFQFLLHSKWKKREEDKPLSYFQVSCHLFRIKKCVTSIEAATLFHSLLEIIKMILTYSFQSVVFFFFSFVLLQVSVCVILQGSIFFCCTKSYFKHLLAKHVLMLHFECIVVMIFWWEKGKKIVFSNFLDEIARNRMKREIKMNS